MLTEKTTEQRDICRCRSGHVELSDLNIAAAFLALDQVAWDGNRGFAWSGIDAKAWQDYILQPNIRLLEIGLADSHVERISRLLRADWTDNESQQRYRAGEIALVPQVVFHVSGVYRQKRKTGTAIVTRWTEADYLAWYHRWFRDGEFVVSPRQFEKCANQLRTYMRERHGFELRRQS